MNYFDCANMLYKYAATATLDPPNQNAPSTSYAQGGAVGLGALGAAGMVSRYAGPKKIENPKYVPGTPKTHKDYGTIGKKTINTPFTKRTGTFFKGMSFPKVKRIGTAGLIGAGLGYLGGSLLDGINENSPLKQAFEYSLFEKLAESDEMSLLRGGAVKKILKEIEEARDRKSFLRDIDCEVCGYQGKPTDKGLCPKCGAVLGVDESKDYVPAITPYTKWNGLPRDGVTVAEQAQMDDVGVWAY